MTRQAPSNPVGEVDRSEDAIAAFYRLSDMLREKGWQPSDAHVCELARMLADLGGARQNETSEPEKFSDGLRKRRDRGPFVDALCGTG